MPLISVQEILNAVYDSSTNKLNTSQTANVEVANNDAGDFRVSAIIDSASVSAKSGDGSQLRVSAIQDGAAALNISAKSNDGGLLRTSSVQDGAAALNVSAKSDDASKLRVSSFFLSLDTTNSVDKVEQQMNYYYLSATGIFIVKATPGLLHSITINKRGTASTLKVYDNTSAASGLQIATIDTTLSTTAFVYDVKTTAGLTVSTADAGAADLTFSYR